MTGCGGDERTLAHFTRGQLKAIGRFGADPQTGQWSWTAPIFRMFGYRPGSVTPTWELMLNHVVREDRRHLIGTWGSVRRQLGPFSWSHRIRTREGQLRSLLFIGHTTPLERQSQKDEDSDSAPAGSLPPTLPIRVVGYAADLTDARLATARAVGTEAIRGATVNWSVIEQAKGALMLAHHVSSETAIAFLMRESSNSRRNLALIASELMERIVSEGLDPATVAGLIGPPAPNGPPAP